MKKTCVPARMIPSPKLRKLTDVNLLRGCKVHQPTLPHVSLLPRPLNLLRILHLCRNRNRPPAGITVTPMSATPVTQDVHAMSSHHAVPLQEPSPTHVATLQGTLNPVHVARHHRIASPPCITMPLHITVVNTTLPLTATSILTVTRSDALVTAAETVVIERRYYQVC